MAAYVIGEKDFSLDITMGHCVGRHAVQTFYTKVHWDQYPGQRIMPAARSSQLCRTFSRYSLGWDGQFLMTTKSCHEPGLLDHSDRHVSLLVGHCQPEAAAFHRYGLCHWNFQKMAGRDEQAALSSLSPAYGMLSARFPARLTSF